MRNRVCLTAVVLTVCLGWLALARAADPAAEAVVRLVQQLGSEQFRQRQEASRGLENLGASALPALQQAAQANDDPEIRQRARELVRLISHRVENARLLKPKLVHLVYKDTAVPAAVADFAAKTGFKLELQGDTSRISGRRITLDTGEVSFWEAFDQFCRQAGLSERSSTPAAANDRALRSGRMIIRESNYGAAQPGDNRLYLVDGPPSALPCWRSSSVRVRALSPAAPVPGLVKTADETFVSLDVLPEPTLAWDSVIDVRIDRAIDDQDQQLSQSAAQLPVAQLGTDMVFMANGMVITDDGSYMPGPRGQTPVRLQRGERPSKFLKELSGSVAVRVLKAEALVTVERLLQAGGQKVRGLEGDSIKVLDITRRANDRVAVRVQVVTRQGLFGANRVVRANGNVIVMRGGGSFTSASTRLAVLDGAGKALPVSPMQRGMNANANGVMEEELELTFTAAQTADLKLVLNGQRGHSLDVPFTLKDVPLP